MACIENTNILYDDAKYLKNKYLNYIKQGGSYENVELDLIRELGRIRMCPAYRDFNKQKKIREILSILLWIIDIQEKKNIYG